MPGASAGERGARVGVVDGVPISAARGVPARVERGVDVARAADSDVLGQPGVEAGFEHRRFMSRDGVERGNLAASVHAGVCAPGKGSARTLARQLLDGRFQRVLDARVALLELGAMVGGPVVF